MKTFEEILKNDDFNSTRLTVGDKWLVWCNDWIVYQKKYGQRVRIVIHTNDKEEAIKKLVEES